jgi:hypothetical protein
MFETDSTIDKTAPCNPPCLLGEAISPGIKTGIVKSIVIQFLKWPHDVEYASSATGSTYAIMMQRQNIDMFNPLTEIGERGGHVPLSAFVRPYESQSPFIVLVDNSADSEEVEEKAPKMRAENATLLKLLDQWSKEPQLGDDQWWEDFDRELREIRKSGWNRS